MIGLDVSNTNPITSELFRQSKAEFLIAKATEGTSFKDGFFHLHRSIAREHNKVFGSYLFLHPNSVGSEASYYLDYAQPQKGDLQPIIDAEITSLGIGELAARILSCALALEHAGYKPILYIGPYLWYKVTKIRPAIKKLPVWEAQYPGHYNFFPLWISRLRIRLKGGRVILWQFTDRYKVGTKYYDGSRRIRNLNKYLIK